MIEINFNIKCNYLNLNVLYEGMLMSPVRMDKTFIKNAIPDFYKYVLLVFKKHGTFSRLGYRFNDGYSTIEYDAVCFIFKKYYLEQQMVYKLTSK